MKKIITIISALSVSIIMYCQNIDTVFVRNLQLKYEEWSWCVGGVNALNLDSLGKKQFKKLVNFLDNQNPAGFSTNITYDSLPGRFALFFYAEYKTHFEARDNMGTGIATKLSGYTPLNSFIAQIDAKILSLFTNRRNFGRDIIE